jgi:hypothetical protein
MATKRKATKRKSTTKRKVGAVHHYHAKPATKRRSHKKVGAISTSTEIVLGAIGGAIATRIIQQNIPGPTAGGSDYRPYTGLVIGAAAEFLGKKNLLIRSMGIGALVEGSRSLITDQMLRPLKVIGSNNQLPYTIHNKVGRKKIKRMMGLQNSLAGTNTTRLIAGTSTPNALAGTQRIYGYDGF